MDPRVQTDNPTGQPDGIHRFFTLLGWLSIALLPIVLLARTSDHAAGGKTPVGHQKGSWYTHPTNGSAHLPDKSGHRRAEPVDKVLRPLAGLHHLCPLWNSAPRAAVFVVKQDP